MSDLVSGKLIFGAGAPSVGAKCVVLANKLCIPLGSQAATSSTDATYSYSFSGSDIPNDFRLGARIILFNGTRYYGGTNDLEPTTSLSWNVVLNASQQSITAPSGHYQWAAVFIGAPSGYIVNGNSYVDGTTILGAGNSTPGETVQISFNIVSESAQSSSSSSISSLSSSSTSSNSSSSTSDFDFVLFGANDSDYDGGYTYNPSDGYYYHENGITYAFYYSNNSWDIFLNGNGDYCLTYASGSSDLSSIEGTHTWTRFSNGIEIGNQSITIVLSGSGQESSSSSFSSGSSTNSSSSESSSSESSSSSNSIRIISPSLYGGVYEYDQLTDSYINASSDLRIKYFEGSDYDGDMYGDVLNDSHVWALQVKNNDQWLNEGTIGTHIVVPNINDVTDIVGTNMWSYDGYNFPPSKMAIEIAH